MEDGDLDAAFVVKGGSGRRPIGRAAVAALVPFVASARHEVVLPGPPFAAQVARTRRGMVCPQGLRPIRGPELSGWRV